LQKVLLLTVLSLAIISPLVQAVGATFFFDPQVTLHWKADPALRNFLSNTSTGSQGQVTVLIVFSEVPSSQQLRELSGLGTIETFTGHVATMHLLRNLLPQIASLDFVSHVSYSRQLSSRLDKSVPEILANQVWNTVRDADGNSVNGTGVVIGVIDSGIDYTHRDFFFPNGTSKIIYLWDQSVTGRPPQGFDYGNECTRPQIQAETCSEFDGVTNDQIVGHGTAVAAVAAGSGQASRAFEDCLLFDGTIWHDQTQQCRGDGNSFMLLSDSSDYRYFGSPRKFNEVYFDIAAVGVYGNFTWEYSRGSGEWGPLPPLPEHEDLALSGAGVADNGTLDFSRSGTVYITAPVDWMTDSVNGRPDQYWIRMSAPSVAKPAMVRFIQGNPPYRGVAPGALIIPVKIKAGNDADVLDGVSYVAKKARELGLPYVVNISLGDVIGSHDGTEPLEIALTDLASESGGVPIVVPSGNSRNTNSHVDGKLTPGESVTVDWTNDPGNNPNYIDLWYSVGDAFGISVTAPDGSVVTGPTPESGVNTRQGNVTILADERASGKEWYINITAKNSLNWSFSLASINVVDGKWDAWTEPGKFVESGQAVLSGQYKIDPSDTIDYPGTAKGVITVGGYMTKYFWWAGCSLCIDHWVQYSEENNHLVHGIKWVSESNVGNITYISGAGPTRDGRTKPDVVAPSANIAAARADNRPQSTQFSDPDDYHQIFRGTSLSTAHVSGVIALMLQMNHFLSPNEIRTILTEDARQDRFTGPIDRQTGSPLWGWGKVDALNSTRDAVKLYSVRIDIDSIGEPFTVNLTRDGQSIATATLNQTRIIILEFQRGGNHTISLSSIIQVDPGTRYTLPQTSWTFSSGAEKSFHYNLQYFLNVTSAYGYAIGTGWYDANSTVVVNVIPSETGGRQFQGWIGSVTSNSQVVEVRMDSSKEMTATWMPTQGTSVAGFVLAIIFSIAVALIVRYKTPKRS